LCFQPTHFESEETFGFLRCSSAIANGVSKDAHTAAAKMSGGTLRIVPLVSNRRSRCASSQRNFESEETFGFPRRSSAIANGVSKDAHKTAAKMDGGTLKSLKSVKRIVR
jgi:hypothetical protein